MQLAQLGKHLKVIELLAEKYKCQIQIELLSAKVRYMYVHVCTCYIKFACNSNINTCGSIQSASYLTNLKHHGFVTHYMYPI